MNYKIKIDNIGKLKEANISVRSFTILAGPNNTGKSFFSKTLYSVFNAMNTNPLLAQIQYCLKQLQDSLEIIQREVFITTIKRAEEHTITKIKERNIEPKLVKSSKILKKCYSLIIKKEEQIFTSIQNNFKINDVDIIEAINKVIELYTQLSKITSDEKAKGKIEKSTSTLKELISSNSEKVITQGFNRALDTNLTGNFQIPNLQDLKRDREKSAFIDITGIGKVTIEDNKVNTEFPSTGIAELQSKSRVVYIESPFYWKLRNALSRVTRTHLFSNIKRRSLSVPKYFNDLNLMLMDELSGEMAFPDIFDDLTKKVIKGNLVTDETGTLKFRELKRKKSHSLPMTATGIVQLGILALLIEKKILDKDSVLFIDEPETNLHPAWQVKMIDILFRLVKAGVHVITATHSPDILKWLEVHLKAHPEDTELIALNQMEAHEDGTVSIVDPDNKNVLEKIIDIKNNLTDPFLDLYLKDQSKSK